MEQCLRQLQVRPPKDWVGEAYERRGASGYWIARHVSNRPGSTMERACPADADDELYTGNYLASCAQQPLVTWVIQVRSLRLLASTATY